jgi:hypothetical protein
MSNPKPLFVMGSKRSGSTFLVSALNVHPQVFITHESDLVWILYQIYKGIPDRFHSYPLDEGKGRWTTLNECSEILASIPSGAGHRDSAIQAFYRVLMHLNEHGRCHWIESEKKRIQWDIPERKKNLAWIGDKKPVQYSDPEIQSFLNNLFPEARYIHLIRNPRFVVASMMEAAEVWPTQDVPVPEYWKGTSQQILDRWATHEEWVFQVKSRLPSKVRTVRLEDLVEDPIRIMSEMFSFLDLGLPAGTEDIYAQWAWKNANQRHQDFSLVASPRASRIMRIYGYED